MRKLFISADIEGTTGIVHWDETLRSKPMDYNYFADQMTREVASACLGARDGGIDEVVVKDGHDSGRNINPRELPEFANIFRGWACHPFSMMYGLDNSFEGVVFTGYHSAAQMTGNPLSHTHNTKNNSVMINGDLASELLINCITAAYVGVPIYCVAGDKGLCQWINTINPEIVTVPVSSGVGRGSLSIHPDVACRRIREAVKNAVETAPTRNMMFPLPPYFSVDVNFKEHMSALNGSYYPGASQTDARVLHFESDDWMDVLKFFHFTL